MFGFDKMFDFNRDGKLDSLERAVQFQFMDDMLKEDHSSSDFDEDEADVFGDAGLDYDELEFMLDLDAYTGGFNLQIAWSTGYVAGNAVCT